MKKLAVSAVLVLGVLTLIAQEGFDYKVRRYFFAGYTGDAAALEKGMEICNQALAANPKNAEALVWHGSGIYYQSFGAFQNGDLATGRELAQRGMKEMDDAVALSPENLRVRIPRGAFLLTSSRYVPDAGIARGMVEKGLGDFEKAYSIQGPDLSRLGTHPRGELLIGLADGYSRLGQRDKAEQWFKRVKAEMKNTAYEDSANLWLEKKALPPRQAGCIGCHVEK